MSNLRTYVGERARRAGKELPYLVRALGLVWQAAPGWTVAWAALLVVQGLLPAAGVYLTKALVNSLVAVIDSHGAAWAVKPALFLALLMAGVLLLTQILGSLAGWVRTAQSELVGDYVTSLVHSQSVRLDLAFYDSHEYYDHLHRARAEAGYRPISLLESIGGLVQNGITLVAMAAILLPYGAWLPVALLVSTAPALLVVVRFRVREHDWQRRVTPDQRRAWYYDWLLTARETAAELRLFGLGDRFRLAHGGVRQRLRAERLRLNRDEGLAQLAAGALALVVTGIVMAWMVYQAMQGKANLGDLALFYSAFSQGQGLMRSLLSSVGQVYSSSLFLGDLFEFLELEPQVVDRPEALAGLPAPAFEAGLTRGADDARAASVASAPPGPGAQAQPAPPIGPAIRFRGVSFRYPAGARMILDGLDLEVPPGQVAAIVGPNGAGKSTLIKLLCRFYDPLAGCVELNGVDLREFAQDALRRQITVLFQDPVAYNGTVSENIAIGNGAAPGAGEVEAAARAAGADGPIARLPHGYDTILGTWFEGGTDLSLGEWQRIALARAFFRRAPIVVLDEPTSAMDSWAEADWLRRFRALVAGRTALIITHRFTTARYADVIHLLDGGRVIESGAHEALLALGGRYAESWQAQMQTDW